MARSANRGRLLIFVVSSLAVTAFLIASALWTAAVAADPAKGSRLGMDGHATQADEDIETGGLQLRDAVQSAGALDAYWDGSKYVVVAPVGSGISPVAWAGLNLPATVGIKWASVSAADVTSVKARIAKVAASRPGRGGWSVYLDLPNGVVLVEGPSDNALQGKLDAEFGDKINYLVTEDTPILTGRLDDTQPFWGGDRITDNWLFPDQGIQCTSGFAVKDANGTRYMATAGHCKELGAGFWTMARDVYGHVRFRANFPETDAELIGDETYGAFIWTGGLCCNANPVVSGGNPFVGSTYCSSGSFSLEQCDHKALAVDVQVCVAEGCIQHTAKFDGSAILKGDSGGPFYFKESGGSIRARGIIVASNLRDRGWATLWNTVLNTFGVSTVTR